MKDCVSDGFAKNPCQRALCSLGIETRIVDPTFRTACYATLAASGGGSNGSEAEAAHSGVGRLVDWAQKHLLDPRLPLASPKDLAIPQCLHTADEAIALIRDHHGKWL